MPMQSPKRRAAIILTVFVLAAGLVTWGVRAVFHKFGLPTTVSARCDVIGTPYELTTEQAEIAATVTAVAVRRKLPTHAAVVALAVGLQESKLRNRAYGDLDSLGVFQQRTSQGWGTERQIMDPRYAANTFYDHLLKVDNWQRIPLTEAAQAVQRSALPEAYAQWEDQATALARTFSGTTAAGLSCTFPEPTVAARPDKVVTLLSAELPTSRLSLSGNVAELRAATPVWATVSWLVAYADKLGVDAVGYHGQRWTRADGWRNDPNAAADRIRLETAQLPPSR
jgi:hypothetical protein